MSVSVIDTGDEYTSHCIKCDESGVETIKVGNVYLIRHAACDNCFVACQLCEEDNTVNGDGKSTRCFLKVVHSALVENTENDVEEISLLRDPFISQYIGGNIYANETSPYTLILRCDNCDQENTAVERVNDEIVVTNYTETGGENGGGE